MLSHPWYAFLVIAHILSAVVGFGALGMSGSYARLARVSADPFAAPGIRRYFRPGTNVAARALYLVPVFGGIALGFSGDVRKIFPYLGFALWVIATGIATGMLWPAERSMQRLIASGVEDREELRRLAIRCERAAMYTTLCFIVALGVMVAQPS